MKVEPLEVNERVADANALVEGVANKLVRNYDRVMGQLHLGGRKAPYDDIEYEFIGGAKDSIRKKHYDKSMRLLWKAEDHAPWSSFKDCTNDEKLLLTMSDKSLDKDERSELKRISSKQYRAMLNREYTPEQKQAIVNILSLIGHGEAYAWLVSSEVLNDVKSTGARAALTMQVLEEAKHFVVLRELLMAFDCEIPRLSAWEYLLLERVYKAKGLEKLFGMNVLVEGIALSLFGLMSEMPGLEILKLFHRDESRHTALPVNYFREFPMSRWQKHNPIARTQRLVQLLPALPIIAQAERDMAVLGFDVFDFGGSLIRKISFLADRVGFYLPVPPELFTKSLNESFNLYCRLTRPNFKHRNFMEAEMTQGAEQLKVEKEVFGASL